MIDERDLYLQCKNHTILFVEDNTALREKTVLILEEYFHTVISASDGEDALEKYVEFKEKEGKYIDIVITDISMPHKNGLELTKDIKSLHPKQIVVVISAHQDSKYLIEFINLGIAHFIPKPIESQKILNVMAKLSHLLLKSNNQIFKDTNFIQINNNLIWDKRKNACYLNDKIIDLTKYDILMIKLLVSNIEAVCTVETIESNFYEHGYDVENENIRNLISRLRRKLPNDTIKNVYGYGYKLSKCFSA